MTIKRFSAVLFVFFLLVGFTGQVNAQPREFKGETPITAELAAYPLMSGPLTAAQMADVAVTPVRLNEAWEGLNFNRKTGRWEYDVLPAGTLVLVDKNNTVRYKADCGNRLVTEITCPECPKAESLAPAPSGNAQAPGFLAAFGQGVRNFLGSWAPLLGWLLGLLLALLLWTLLMYLVAWIWRNLLNWFSTPAPAPVPQPVAPLPNQGNGDLGLFTRVELTDAGPDGFTVTGYREDGLPRFLGFRQHVEGDRVGGNGRHRISVSNN